MFDQYNITEHNNGRLVGMYRTNIKQNILLMSWFYQSVYFTERVRIKCSLNGAANPIKFFIQSIKWKHANCDQEVKGNMWHLDQKETFIIQPVANLQC